MIQQVPQVLWLCSDDCSKTHNALKNWINNGLENLPPHLCEIIRKKVNNGGTLYTYKGSQHRSRFDPLDAKQVAFSSFCNSGGVSELGRLFLKFDDLKCLMIVLLYIVMQSKYEGSRFCSNVFSSIDCKVRTRTDFFQMIYAKFSL